MQDIDLLNKVKGNLKLTDDSKDLIILDIMQDIKNYCNLEYVPVELEPFIRKKVKSIIDYENEKDNGDTSVYDIKSIKEGDTTITYNVDGNNNSKENIYGLSDNERTSLKLFRRIRR